MQPQALPISNNTKSSFFSSASHLLNLSMANYPGRDRRSYRGYPTRYTYAPRLSEAQAVSPSGFVYVDPYYEYYWRQHGRLANMISSQPGRNVHPGYPRGREPENPSSRSFFDSPMYREAGFIYDPEDARSRRPPPPYTHHGRQNFDPYGENISGIPTVPDRGVPDLPESEYCPLCLVPFTTLSASTPAQREAHITSCIATASSSTPPTPAHLADSPSAFHGQHPRHSGTNRNRIYYVLGEKELDTMERDKKNECPICMEGYEVGHDMGRLECLCRFHKECIDKWFGAQGMRKRCPIHFHW